MFRASGLSSSHYAYRWTIPDSKGFHDQKRVNELGIEYATSKDELRRQDIQLEILQCFHGYLIKYLNMVIHGTLSSLNGPAGKEATLFLRTLMAGGSDGKDRMALLATCRTLHLAFKQMTADDIYDTLVFCMIRALNKYDPLYTDKVKLICEDINGLQLPARKSRAKQEFDAATITESLGFDTSVYLRLLVNRGYLLSVAGPKKKVIGYRRAKAWPPAPAFFESGPIGLVYFLPRYFRYYLHDHISKEMSAIESKEGVLQLEHAGAAGSDSSSDSIDGWTIPHMDGNMTSSSGTKLMADLKLLQKQSDVSELTLEWVAETSDKLFKSFTVRQRYILYLLYAKAFKWPEIASTLESTVPAVRKEYQVILGTLQRDSAPLKSAKKVKAP